MGLRHLSPRRAAQELDSLFSAQWQDGRLPQIVFDPRRDDDYSPGASFWRSDLIPGAPHVPTAGLVQPPVHAWAALAVHRSDPAESARREFLHRAYPRLVAWHEYLRTRRDRGRRGLISIVHPWESGLDNSPLWDSILRDVRAAAPAASIAPPRPDLLHADASERPTTAEYNTYLQLAGRYRDHGCDDMDEDFPFLVEDPTVNALYAVSELALAAIAEELGLPSDDHRTRAKHVTESLGDLWDGELGVYVARDVVTGNHQREATISGLVPLLLPGVGHAEELLETLRGPRFGLGSVHMVPSYDMTAPGFDPARYWRGPSWFNMAWLMIQALRSRGLSAEAATVAAQVRRLAVSEGFPEYVDPLTGSAHGTRSFSWTAALSLDLELNEKSVLP